MRKPASFTRFLIVACYSVCVVQVVVGGLLILSMFGGGRAWTVSKPMLLADAAFSTAAVLVIWIRYRRGDLDKYDHRPRRDF